MYYSYNIVRYLFLITFFCTVVSVTNAQSVTTDSVGTDSVESPKKKPSLGKRLNTKLTNRYYKTKYDTNYVARPKEKWLFRLMANHTANYIHAKGTVNDVYSKYDLHTKSNNTIGLEVNYCDIAVTLSLNPAKIGGKYNDYEFNFEYHGQRISLDINYLRANSLSGDIRFRDIDHLDEEGLRMNVVNASAYYVFNHRKFSYPAALYQNYYQLRSAGSWLAGLSVQAGSIKTTDELKATFVIYKHNTLEVNNNEMKDHGMHFNMIFNERASIVYHFTPRYLGGASAIVSNSIYDKRNISFNQNKWLIRAFFGVRL